MRYYCTIFFAIFSLQFLYTYSNEYQNPDGGKWITIDSVPVPENTLVSGNSPSYFFGLASYDSLNIVMAYGDFMSGASYYIIRKTSDGGETWFDIHEDISEPKYANRRYLFYPKKDLIIVGCDSGYVLRSTDDGNNWTYSKITTTLKDHENQLNFMWMKGNIAIMSYSGSGNTFISRDGGENWESLFANNKAPNGIFPGNFSILDDNTIIMNGVVKVDKDKYNYYFKSTNAGKNWSLISDEFNLDIPPSHLKSKFLNEYIGYSRENEVIVKGNGGDIKDTSLTTFYKTTDGGKSWNIFAEFIVPGQIGYSQFIVYDELNFFTQKIEYGYAYTSNGGDTWETSEYFIYNGTYEYGMSFTEPIFLTPNTIVKTSGPKLLKYVGNSTSVNESKSQSFSIYPNPAGDFINISIDSAEGLLAREVQILDLLGLVVSKTELTDGNKRIDISDLPRGTYFIKVGDKLGRFVKM